MTSRERVKTIIAGGQPDRCGFWLGKPHDDTWPKLFNYFGTTDEEELRQKLNDDFRWINPTYVSYKHPEKKPIFDTQPKSNNLSAAGVFSACESVQEVEDFDWPNCDYLDFSETIVQLNNTGDYYRASGTWGPFFHDLCNFFGMEEYFIKMYTNPEVVHAVTRHVVDFYLEANRRYYDLVGDKIDGFFFGNDFGTQFGLLIKPEHFNEFVFPYFKELTEQAHKYNYQVILHSCGSIYEVIPQIIELGADALHPLQAKAANMDAETLAKDFKDKIAFVGGIDTQDLLVHGTSKEIKEEVKRIKNILGPNLVVSPSHEALLPNVPPENVLAMAEAVYK